MNISVDTILVFLVLTNLFLLGSSRLGSCINTFAIQGFLLGMWMILENWQALTIHLVALIGVTLLLKAFVFPWLLFRAIREASIQREIEPYVGYTTSLLVGILSLVLAMWITAKLSLPTNVQTPFVVSVALSTMMVGLFIIIGRKTALNQVLGYLVLENGIYLFGNVLVGKIPILLDLGVLLDVFVAVFVMGIAIYRIHKEFDHIDAAQLSALKG